MAIQQGVWGIDLGQCALKALRLEVVDGQITATAFDYVEHPKILSQPDADPDQLTREALEKFLSRNNLKGDVVAISVPGQSGLARFVKLPPVEEKKIPDIVRFEAKQQIPFNLDEVVWDYQKISAGPVNEGFTETEIGLFAIKRDTVNRYLQHFNEVGVEVHVVQMSPLALCNFVSFDLLNKGGDAPATEEEEESEDTAGKKKCVVALDIGTDNSNLVITDGERIIWQRPIPLGGNHFTRALTKDLKLTFAKAEHLKRNATKSPDLKKILLALRPVLNDFVGEVQRSLGYFTNTHRDSYVKYMMGLGNAFRLPGLQKFLSEKLQLEVRKLGKMNRLGGDSVVTAPSYAENVLSFAVAYGLALQGLKLPRLQTNLLPHEIRTERLIRAKKPWAVAAAAALLFGSTFMTLGYGLQYRAVAGPGVDDAIKAAEAVTSRARGYANDYSTKQTEIDKKGQAVKAILAGSSERYNWLEFAKFLSEALPRPDGSNLLDRKTDTLYYAGNALRVPGRTGKERLSPKEGYWTEEAQLAFAKFLAEQTGSGSSKDKDDDEGLEYLIQANIVSVLSLYSDNLENYFTRLKQDKLAQTRWDSMLKRDQDEPPKGKGWVVELRGYTYHHDNIRFVEMGVARNLATYLQPVPPAAPAKTDGSSTPAPAGGGQPPPPATPPVDGGSTPAADSTEPIPGRVSHVILFRAERDNNPEPHQFRLIGGSQLGGLIGAANLGGGAGGAGGGSADMATGGGGSTGGGVGALSRLPPGGGDSGTGEGGGAAGGGQRGSWQPLGSVTLQGSTGGGGGVGSLDPAGGGRLPGGGEIGTAGSGTPDIATGGGSGVGTVGSTPATAEKPAAKKKLIRTEFVILFVWREPTPSDDLLGTGDGSTPPPPPPPPGGGG